MTEFVLNLNVENSRDFSPEASVIVDTPHKQTRVMPDSGNRKYYRRNTSRHQDTSPKDNKKPTIMAERFLTKANFKDGKTDATIEELLALLPTSPPTQNARKILQCTYPKCTAIATESQQGLCATHFIQIFNCGHIQIPLSSHRHATHSKHDVITREKTNMAALEPADSAQLPVRDYTTSHKIHNQTRKPEVTVKQLPDIIESSASDDELLDWKHHSRQQQKVKKSRLCVSGICSNRGQQTFNGLCRDCYFLLVEHRLQGYVPQPQPKQPSSPTMYRCKCQSKSRCKCCTRLIEGGGFCADCSRSKSSTLHHGTDSAFHKNHVLNSAPRAAHRLSNKSAHQQRIKTIEDRCGRSCDCRRYHGDVRDVEFDGVSDSSYESLQPSDSGQYSGFYSLTIGQETFIKSTTHFPNDRG